MRHGSAHGSVDDVELYDTDTYDLNRTWTDQRLGVLAFVLGFACPAMATWRVVRRLMRGA